MTLYTQQLCAMRLKDLVSCSHGYSHDRGVGNTTEHLRVNRAVHHPHAVNPVNAGLAIHNSAGAVTPHSAGSGGVKTWLAIFPVEPEDFFIRLRRC